MTRDELHELYLTRAVTLDGRPAQIVGWRNDFATIVAKLPTGFVAHDWSWASVQRALLSNGKFKS